MSALASARRHVASVLPSWGLPAELLEDACLIGSELVANGVQATLTLDVPEPVGLRLLGNEQHVVIEVWDCGPGLPARQPAPDFGAESGRGLQIVEALTNRWGCRQASAHVKSVWAELLLPRPLARRTGQEMSPGSQSGGSFGRPIRTSSPRCSMSIDLR